VIPISRPALGEMEEKLVLEVLRSGRLVQGPMVERFEESVREVVGTRHAVAVNNGTSALIAALLANGVGPGDEVVTSPFTFVATLNSILHVGARPRFVDIGDDFNLDTARLEGAIGPATRAVIPVHLYGCPADMGAIVEATGPDIPVVEDAAQALGASIDGVQVGAFGTACFSFYATKNVTTGEGGVVTTDDDGIAATLRVLRNQGQRSRYDYERPGFNLRMSELHAAVGVAQMSRLLEVIEDRRANAAALSEGLRGLEALDLPGDPPGGTHVYHQYTVRVNERSPLTRDELADHLQRRGIGSGVYYPKPVFDHECFVRDPRVETPPVPRTRRACEEVLSIPVHPGLTSADVARIVDAIRDVLR
jgi:perosamine synthetase